MSSQKPPANAGAVRSKEKVLLLTCEDNQVFSDILLSLNEFFDCVRQEGSQSENEYDTCRYSLIIPRDKANILQMIGAAKLRHSDKPCFVYLPSDMKVDIDNILSAGLRDITVVSCEKGETGSRLSKLIAARKEAEFKRDLLLKFSKQFLVGKSQSFQTVLQNVLKVSDVQSPVLITGETGTGKELFARAIHYLSQRSGKAFIPLNCGGLHEQLFENELFGHVKGAYTGAIDTRPGVINEATGGTLFLDEINTLSTLSQVKLLRFLEDKTYRKLGSANLQEVDIRILSATNIKLEDAVTAEKFREDLLYRINALTIELPPLRDRIGDISLLTEHFLRQFSLENERPRIYISDKAVKKLCAWRWPGNVRELKNVVTKSAIMCSSNIIREDDVFVRPIKENSFDFTYKEAKDRTLEHFERDYVARLLTISDWNITRASKSAQMSRQSFYRLIKKHNIPVEELSVTSLKH